MAFIWLKTLIWMPYYKNGQFWREMGVFSEYSRNNLDNFRQTQKFGNLATVWSGNTKNASKKVIHALSVVNEPSQNIELPFCKTTCLFSGLIWEKESEIGTC